MNLEVITDEIIANLCCEIIHQAITDARRPVTKMYRRTLKKNHLEEIYHFANDKSNFWWTCLEVFSELDVDRIRNNIKRICMEEFKNLNNIKS